MDDFVAAKALEQVDFKVKFQTECDSYTAANESIELKSTI